MFKKILITYGLRPLAQRVERMLAVTDKVMYGSCEEIPEVLMHSGRYKPIPHASSPSYCHEMLTLCLDEGVDVLLPLGADEVQALAEGQTLFEEYGISIWMPDREALHQLPLCYPDKGARIRIFNEGVSVVPPDGLSADVRLSGLFILDAENEYSLCCISN